MRLLLTVPLIILFAGFPPACAGSGGGSEERPRAPGVSAEATQHLLADLSSCRLLSFDIAPALGTLEPGTGSLPCSLGSSGGYVLELTGSKSENWMELTFSLKRADGAAFKVISYGAVFDVDKIPALRNAKFANEGPGSLQTVGYRNPPAICVRNEDGSCPVVIGFADQVEFAQLKVTGNALKLSRPAAWESITTTELRDGFYLDFSNRPWFDALKDYTRFADAFRRFKANPIPPQAYEPVWCSWYPFTTNANEKSIWENAVEAKALGFGTVLIDAGWDESGGVMQYDSAYGDRVADPAKFPDLTGLVDRVHKVLGLKVELWASPWCVGKNAKAAAEIGDCRLKIGNEESIGLFLCPRRAKTGDFVARSLADVFERYHIDGMWWDFADGIPTQQCAAQHRHDYETLGQGYNACMGKIVRAIREVKPDALIEVRLHASNINNKQFVNVMETADTPLSYNANRAMMTYVRALSDGCVPKMDPTMWVAAKDEGIKVVPDETVARYMATVITAGVPAVSQDLTKLPESHKRVIKAYLGFYHAHMKDMMAAEFRPVSYAKDYPSFILEGQEAVYLYSAADSVPAIKLKKPHGRLYVINACKGAKAIDVTISGLHGGRYTWKSRNCSLTGSAEGAVQVTDDFHWSAPAPEGGMVEMRLGVRSWGLASPLAPSTHTSSLSAVSTPSRRGKSTNTRRSWPSAANQAHFTVQSLGSSQCHAGTGQGCLCRQERLTVAS